ncbi:phosphoribosylformylglycinamidine cyclo-ligase chloroplastic/mitochondrial-like, partial [Trifolium pratense]
MSLGACTDLSHSLAAAAASVKPNSRNCNCTPGITYSLRNATGGHNGVLSMPMSKKNENRVVAVKAEGQGLTYKDAGVDIDAGSELVRRIAKMAPGIGGFGGLFPL